MSKQNRFKKILDEYVTYSLGGDLRKNKLQNIILALFEKEEEGVLEDYIVKVLLDATTPIKDDKGHVIWVKGYITEDVAPIAKGVIHVDNIILSYSEYHPLTTIHGHKVYFYPDKNHNERGEKELDAYIKYAAHFVSSEITPKGGTRKYNTSKEKGVALIEVMFKDPKIQKRKQPNPDGTTSTVYIKELPKKRHFAMILRAEVKESGELRFITLMPKIKKERPDWKPDPTFIEIQTPTSESLQIGLPHANKLSDESHEGGGKDTSKTDSFDKKINKNTENTDIQPEKLSIGGEINAQNQPKMRTLQTDKEALQRLSTSTLASEQVRKLAAMELKRLELEAKDTNANSEELQESLENTREMAIGGDKNAQEIIGQMEEEIKSPIEVQVEEIPLIPMDEEDAIELVQSTSDEVVAEKMGITVDEVNAKVREAAVDRLMRGEKFADGGTISVEVPKQNVIEAHNEIVNEEAVKKVADNISRLTPVNPWGHEHEMGKGGKISDEDNTIERAGSKLELTRIPDIYMPTGWRYDGRIDGGKTGFNSDLYKNGDYFIIVSAARDFKTGRDTKLYDRYEVNPGIMHDGRKIYFRSSFIGMMVDDLKWNTKIEKANSKAVDLMKKFNSGDFDKKIKEIKYKVKSQYGEGGELKDFEFDKCKKHLSGLGKELYYMTPKEKKENTKGLEFKVVDKYDGGVVYYTGEGIADDFPEFKKGGSIEKEFPAEHYRYITIKKEPSGLLITPTKEGLEYITDEKEMNPDKTDDDILLELFEDVHGNSEYVFHANLGISGLVMTDAEGVSWGYAYDGDIFQTQEEGCLYWYPNYAIKSPLDDLIEGRLFFDKAPDEEYGWGGKIKSFFKKKPKTEKDTDKDSGEVLVIGTWKDKDGELHHSKWISQNMSIAKSTSARLDNPTLTLLKDAKHDDVHGYFLTEKDWNYEDGGTLYFKGGEFLNVIKKRNHERKKNTTLDVLDEMQDKAPNSKEKQVVEEAYDIVDEEYKKGGKVEPEDEDEQPTDIFKKGGEIKEGTILKANTGVELKVLKYDDKFGGRVLVERADGTLPGQSKWVSVSKFNNYADGGKITTTSEDDDEQPSDNVEFKRGGVTKAVKESNIHDAHKGMCKGKGSVIQSIIIPKEGYNLLSARKWLKKYGYKMGKVDKTESSYRFRQLSPITIEKDTFRTIELGDKGVKAVIGCVKKKYDEGGSLCGCGE